MKNRDDLSTYLADVAAALDRAELSALDFDDLRRALLETASLLGQAEALRAELAILRDDCVTRTAGMLRAVAAVTQNRARVLEVRGEIDRLSSLPAPELVATYHRAAARFRDAFPVSFGGGLARNRRPGKDLSDFR